MVVGHGTGGGMTAQAECLRTGNNSDLESIVYNTGQERRIVQMIEHGEIP